ncbi:uncharacterized protein LOC122250859 isoform X2 [Penaeus japonicus]|uniref:uncharacterized protein LOC122250859 isoform X2 n=1 Tax=Penaeus japonicus TaxID=27405 RepID=UPI001C70B190|nr:uncharacterized protein LOC122250859 isoform X2 [Penaeus japonicus]
MGSVGKNTSIRSSIIAVAVTLLLIVMLTWAMITTQTPVTTEPSCGKPTVDTCFQDMLEGPPPWDDPQLLQLIREEFLKTPPVHLKDTSPILEGVEVEVLEALNRTIGPVNFLVATVGVNLELVKHLSERAGGLWIDPQPKHNPAPSQVSNMWASHACLTPASLTYLNTKNEQCLSLASLLTALDTPSVDLVMTSGTKLESVLYPLCVQYPKRPKALLAGRLLRPEDLPEDYRDCTRSLLQVAGQYTIVFFHPASPSKSRQDL